MVYVSAVSDKMSSIMVVMSEGEIQEKSNTCSEHNLSKSANRFQRKRLNLLLNKLQKAFFFEM